MEWILLDEIPSEDLKPYRPPPLQGNCGHFVRYTGYRTYYNGNYTCAQTLYVCTRCGPGAIEHV